MWLLLSNFAFFFSLVSLQICVWGIYMVRDVNDFLAVGRPMHLSSPEVRERERDKERERRCKWI